MESRNVSTSSNYWRLMITLRACPVARVYELVQLDVWIQSNTMALF